MRRDLSEAACRRWIDRIDARYKKGLYPSKIIVYQAVGGLELELSARASSLGVVRSSVRSSRPCRACSERERSALRL